MQNKNNLAMLGLAFESLSVYRALLQDNVLRKLQHLINSCIQKSLTEFIKGYNDFYFSLLGNQQSNNLKEYISVCLVFDDNVFTWHFALQDIGSLAPSLKKAVLSDLHYLQLISEIPSSLLKEYALEHFCDTGFEHDAVRNLPDWETTGITGTAGTGTSVAAETSTPSDGKEGHPKIISELCSAPNWPNCLELLADFHKQQGSGIFARFKGFIWERKAGSCSLRGIEAIDPIRLSDMTGYELERSIVIENTLQLLRGMPANNILLYGDRGTGKSSTVKALLHQYHQDGLRIIELPKALLADFPEVIRVLKDRKQKFILFIDDLAFEDNEEHYTSLKAILEGGLESKPQNIVIYATSNRRHLIKEKFSDRQGLMYGSSEDEVRAADTMQEKLSLADRFGITVTFSSPDKYQYLEIVENLAAKRGLQIEKEQLHKEALKWELRYNGRSPRTARQFIDWLEGQ